MFAFVGLRLVWCVVFHGTFGHLFWVFMGFHRCYTGYVNVLRAFFQSLCGVEDVFLKIGGVSKGCILEAFSTLKYINKQKTTKSTPHLKPLELFVFCLVFKMFLHLVWLQAFSGVD